MDLFSWSEIHSLTILDIKGDKFYAIPLNSKDEAGVVLKGWASSMGISPDAVFLSDRGGEVESLTALGIGKHVKTASYSPQANGRIERAHRELGVMCRIYGITPDEVTKIWQVNMALNKIPEPGELFLRYI